jgi:hypothetical protein
LYRSERGCGRIVNVRPGGNSGTPIEKLMTSALRLELRAFSATAMMALGLALIVPRDQHQFT